MGQALDGREGLRSPRKRKGARKHGKGQLISRRDLVKVTGVGTLAAALGANVIIPVRANAVRAKGSWSPDRVGRQMERTG